MMSSRQAQGDATSASRGPRMPFTCCGKTRHRWRNSQKASSGAEARIDFAAFAARLKSRPDTELTTLGFFPAFSLRGEGGLTFSDEVAP
jgi:hypothetical protein